MKRKPPPGFRHPRNTHLVLTLDGFSLPLPEWVEAGEQHRVHDNLGRAWLFVAGYHGRKYDRLRRDATDEEV